MIIQAAVTRKTFYANIAKNHLQFLVMPTSTTTDATVRDIIPFQKFETPYLAHTNF